MGLLFGAHYRVSDFVIGAGAGPSLTDAVGSAPRGVFSLAYAPPFLPERFDRAGQVVAGIASGILGGLTAIWAAPMMAYLIARRVDRDEFVRAVGTMIFIGSAPLILGFWHAGLITGP